MGKSDSSAQVVSDLLAERKKLEGWLAKLDATADASKAAVAGKVRADYQKRLDEVTGELAEHEDGLSREREKHASALEDLRADEAARAEEMAEAELRHAVGEYSDARFKEKKATVTGKLESIRTGIAEAEAAIASLDEVLGFIAGRADDGDADEEEEVPEPPKKGKKGTTGQTEAFGDELAFLKSVSDDDEDGPSATRASGAVQMPELEPAPAETPKKTPASVQKDSGAPSVGQSRPSVMNQRTLKCRECGGMNLPTEWYCEKCGAELAAL